MVAVLLSDGADVNQTDNYGQKPIDVALNQEIKDMLIAHAAKVVVEEDDEEEDVDEVFGDEEGEEDGETDPETAHHNIDFIQAAKNGDLTTVQSLVDKVKINSKDGTGCTALNNAATYGHLDVVQFLLARKDVDVNLASVRLKVVSIF